MKIIFIVANMTGGGTERVIASLANYFVSKKNEVVILMTAGSEIAYILNEKISVVKLGEQTNRNIKKRFERILKMRAIFKESQESNLISFGTETNMFTILATLGMKSNLIISERNDPAQCQYKCLRNIIYRFANKFVFQTNDARNHFCRQIRNRGVIIENPLTNNLPQPFMGERKNMIVSVGRLTEQKNHMLLLKAFAIFNKRIEGYKLVIYGEGKQEEKLKQYCRENYIDDRVFFEGFVENVLEEIKQAKMYILSSDYEGISNSLLEAMALGLPVISTDCPIGGPRLCIESDKNGLLVPVNNVEKLESAMEKLALNKELREGLSQNAIKVRESFSIDNIAIKWLTLLR